MLTTLSLFYFGEVNQIVQCKQSIIDIQKNLQYVKGTFIFYIWLEFNNYFQIFCHLINKIMIPDQPIQQSLKQEQKLQIIDNASSQQADPIIEHLHQKFNHRLRLGYYCRLPSSRKRLYQSSRTKDILKISKIRNQNPAIHKLQKKSAIVESQNNKVYMVDQQQTTDQILLADHQQNTSLLQIQEDSLDPILEEKSIQWSCQETVIEQKEEFIQYQLEMNDRQQQFPLPQEAPKYQEISIQCQEQKQQIIEEPKIIKIDRQVSTNSLPPLQIIKIPTKNVEMQCEISNKPINSNAQVQYSEPKPELKEKRVQIQLPDINQERKIERLNIKIKHLRQEQHKQTNIRKQVSHQIQIIKLKKILSQLEGKIDLIETKEDYAKEKLQQQFLRKKRQDQFIRQKELIKTKYQSECKIQLNKVLEKLQSTQPIRRQSLPKQHQTAKLQINTDKQQESLAGYKKQFNTLKEDLKKQMIKRLKIQKESEQDTIQVLSHKQKYRSSFQLLLETKKSQLQILQSPRRKQFTGSIVKNILRNPQQIEQKSPNKYCQDAALSRAYWRQKSSFDYKYELDFERRLSRKQKYLQKLDI